MGALPGEVAYQALCWALEDAETVQRYRSKIVTCRSPHVAGGAGPSVGGAMAVSGWPKCRAVTW